MPRLDEFLRIQDAAKHLGVCRNTLRNWCRQGKIPEYRHPVNNYRLFKVSDVDHLLRGTEKAVNRAGDDQFPRRPK